MNYPVLSPTVLCVFLIAAIGALALLRAAWRARARRRGPSPFGPTSSECKAALAPYVKFCSGGQIRFRGVLHGTRDRFILGNEDMSQSVFCKGSGLLFVTFGGQTYRAFWQEEAASWDVREG